ncbi:hypothetical protein NQ317_008831 [Molorchus minor]|uniref:Uncharacterized protein n=1 Tax=Molorchus minor TaxID=1323400 RepID=A0ABQ9IVY1_9CUCU|nr:hypothetical protein NQ317_008831 [Molorchus minor]
MAGGWFVLRSMKQKNPTPHQDELFQNSIWPVVTSNNITYMDIGKDFKVKSNMDKYNIKFWKDLYKTHGTPPYDTY